jgi:hypothetical protein
MRSGEIIVGTHGLMVNDVLHVWNVPMSWLVNVELELGPPAMMTISYVITGRYGPQHIGVLLPVPSEAIPLAEEVKRRLDPMAVRHRGRTRRKRTGPSSADKASLRSRHPAAGTDTVHPASRADRQAR